MWLIFPLLRWVRTPWVVILCWVFPWQSNFIPYILKDFIELILDKDTPLSRNAYKNARVIWYLEHLLR